MRYRPLSIALFALSCSLAPLAHADTLNFTYTGGAAGYSGSGSLTATSTSTAGQYLVTAISGGGAGGSITGLISPMGLSNRGFVNDNLLFPAGSSLLDAMGLAFTVAAGADTFQVDLFADPGSPSGYSAFYQDEDGSTGTANLTSFVLTPAAAATPEPSSFLLLGTALLGSAGLVRRRFVHS